MRPEPKFELIYILIAITKNNSVQIWRNNFGITEKMFSRFHFAKLAD